MATELALGPVVADLELRVDLFETDVPLGGLSGLTFDPACGVLYAVSDDRGQLADPRVYVLQLDLDGRELRPLDVLTLLDRDGEPFEGGLIDAEAVALAPDGMLWVATEGVSYELIPPRIMGFRLDGALTAELVVPQAYLPGDGSGVRSNHGFEGLTVTPDGSRIIAAVEAPLAQDGPVATLDRGAVVRLVIFDTATRRAIAERAYQVEPVPDEPRPATAYHSTGVSEILALDDHRVLVVERSFSAGVGNRVRLFVADLRSGDDVTGAASLPGGVRPVDKRLIADVADLGVEPDNLEGLAVGPELADGRPALVLVSDNNFQPTEQRNQLLVVAVDGLDPPALGRIPAQITEIQGAGHTSPLVGRCVRDVEGTVTAILGQRKGQAFWVQQAPPDDDPATSEGLFVTAVGGLPAVGVGDRVRLTGRVEEPRWGAELPVTRLVADGLEIVGRGHELPAPVIMGSAGRAIPTPTIDDDGLTVFEPSDDAIDFYESLEGMRVRVDSPVVVGPTSRYGEITVLGDGGAGAAPRSGRGGVVLEPDDAHPERVIIDDRLMAEPPAAGVGDHLVGPVDGVLHYSYGAYKLLNTERLEVARRPARQPTSTTLVADERHLTVATFNVENLSARSDEGELTAIARTIVDGLNGPSVLALQEIQDDSGPDDDGTVSAAGTLARLVDAVAAAGGPDYAWQQIDPENNADGGRPGANIRVALLVDSSRVKLPGRSSAGPAARVAEGPSLRPNPALVEPDDAAFADSRKPLAVELEAGGEPLFIVVCHLRSKGGDDPLFGRRQPPVRWSEEQRAPQARAVRRLVDELLDADPDARVVVLGDLNDFEFSDSVGILAAPPMVNLMARLPEAERSTFVYLGSSQTLDHVIVSPVLAEGAEIEVAHVSADRPASERASDHDPVIARIRLR